MQDYSSGVFIEGDSPLEYVDLAVFVAPPLPRGTSLLRRILREHSTGHAVALDAWERALESPEKLGRLLTGGFGEPLLEAALADPRAFEQTRTKMVQELAKLRAAPPPQGARHGGRRESRQPRRRGAEEDPGPRQARDTECEVVSRTTFIASGERCEWPP